MQEEQASKMCNAARLNLEDVERASLLYDPTTDMLHIILSDEEADEVILLENNLVLRLKDCRLIEIDVAGLSSYLPR